MTSIAALLTILSSPAEARVPAFKSCPVQTFSWYGDGFGAYRRGGYRHKGIDIYAPTGTPVRAVEPGSVNGVFRVGRGGLVIRIRGASGTGYYNAHLSRASVRAGQRVHAGQEIGRVGSSGSARFTGPHLHFEIRPGGPGSRAINPGTFVRRSCGLGRLTEINQDLPSGFGLMYCVRRFFGG